MEREDSKLHIICVHNESSVCLFQLSKFVKVLNSFLNRHK